MPGSSASCLPARRRRTATRRRCPSARTCRRNPLSPYALQKLVGEQYLQMFTRLYGLETVTIRYFNVFGPRQDPSSAYSGVISRVPPALDERSIADHSRRRRTDARLHVRRATSVDGVLLAAERRDAVGRGDQRRHRSAHLAERAASRRVQSLTGSTIVPSYGTARAGDVRDSQADIARQSACSATADRVVRRRVGAHARLVHQRPLLLTASSLEGPGVIAKRPQFFKRPSRLPPCRSRAPTARGMRGWVGKRAKQYCPSEVKPKSQCSRRVKAELR